MGAHETVLHSYDIAAGLELDLDPPDDALTSLLQAQHPDHDPTDDPLGALVRASGRPFSATEWTAFRAERDARRAVPPPAGASEGVISDFTDGEPTSRFGKGWFAWSDSQPGGTSDSRIAVVESDEPFARHALRVTGTIRHSEARPRFVGTRFRAGRERGETVNLSGHPGLRFWARGIRPNPWR